MYNKQSWKDEIPDLTKPVLDANGKQKTDPQTGRPLYELVQEGTRITSTRLNNLETGIGSAHDLVEMLAEELGGNFVASSNGAVGFKFSTKDLTVSWTSGIAYVGGRRLEVPVGNLVLNPTQGQYLYLDLDGTIKKTTSEATAATALLLWYVATDTSGVITSTDKRSIVNMAEILKKIENIEVDIPDATLTVKGITKLNSAVNSTSETEAATPKAVKAAYDRAVPAMNKLANDFKGPDALIGEYPEGITVFYVGGGTGGQGIAWRTATGSEPDGFGYVETVRAGGGGYQVYTEMYGGSDENNKINNKQYKRTKRDSNSFWQPFEKIIDQDDFNVVMAEAQAGKQAGNERKAEVVAALVAKGIPATTSETWESLIIKLTAIVRATGTAVLAEVLEGKTFSTSLGNAMVGTMPPAKQSATGTVRAMDSVVFNLTAGSGQVNFGRLLVTGLTFSPKNIIITSTDKSRFTYYIRGISLNGHFNADILTGELTTGGHVDDADAVMVSGNASISSSGFSLPVPHVGSEYTWTANE